MEEETVEYENIEKGLDETLGFYLVESGMYIYKDYLIRHKALTIFGKIVNWVCIFILLVYAYSSVVAIQLEDVPAFTESAHVFIAYMVLGTSTITSHLKTKDVNKFLNTVGKGFFLYNDASEEQNRIKDNELTKLRFYMKIYYIYIWLVAITISISTAFNYFRTYTDYEITNNRVIYPVQMFLPAGIFTVEGVAYSIVVALGEGFVISVKVPGVDFTFASHVTTLTTQFKILNKSVQTIEWRAMVLYSKKFGCEFYPTEESYSNIDFQNCMYECLRENIQHHILIKKTFKTIQSYLGLSLLILMFSSAILLASNATAFVRSEDKLAIHSILFLLLGVGEFLCILVFCWYGEGLATESEQFFQELYNTPWYKCNVKYRKTLAIAMANSLTSCIPAESILHIPANLETFNSILSAAYTYFNALSQF